MNGRHGIVCVALLAVACAGDREGASAAEPELGDGVLALVNGREITEEDLRLSVPGGAARPLASDMARRRGMLEAVIREDLAAERAEALGLELGPEDRSHLRRLEAASRSFRRSRLAALYETHEQSALEVSDADARRYFDANAGRIRSELHVAQILHRREAPIDQALARLRAGASFDEVAGALVPEGAGASRPWDLGYLRWNQVPEAWGDALSRLEPGQTSEIIRGPRSRFWIVQLVDRRVNEQITFESERTTIVELLRAERLEQRRSRMTRELREGARVVYVERPSERLGASGQAPEEREVLAEAGQAEP